YRSLRNSQTIEAVYHARRSGMKRVLSFVLGVTGGALVGATVAILLAPSSGDDLRTDLRSRFNRFGDELKDAAQQRRTELERQLSNLRQPQGEIPLEER
ncbi:MAG: YtxH domain-containing protein, partial [Anaerolineales bacterium]